MVLVLLLLTIDLWNFDARDIAYDQPFVGNEGHYHEAVGTRSDADHRWRQQQQYGTQM
jgi:hypothetical protein